MQITTRRSTVLLTVRNIRNSTSGGKDAPDTSSDERFPPHLHAWRLVSYTEARYSQLRDALRGENVPAGHRAAAVRHSEMRSGYTEDPPLAPYSHGMHAHGARRRR